MRIDAPTTADVLSVARAMRPDDRKELEAATGFKGAQLETYLADMYGDAKEAFGAWDGDQPVAIGAMVPLTDGSIAIGMFATDGFHKIAVPLTRFVTRRLFPAYDAQGFTRAVCLSVGNYEKAHRWIALLGMTPVKTHIGAGRGGEDFIEFERVWANGVASAAGNG